MKRNKLLIAGLWPTTKLTFMQRVNARKFVTMVTCNCVISEISLTVTILSYTQKNTKFFKPEIYHCHYSTSGNHNNELLSVNTLHERKLCSKSRMSKQVLFECIVSIMWVLIIIWCVYVKCSILSKGDSLKLTLCVCYSWEVALKVDLEASFDNI
jgi:hypothetical protein